IGYGALSRKTNARYPTYQTANHRTMMQVITVRTEFITLGQVLKLSGVIDSGARAKEFLEHNPVLVNGESEQRRGRKLYPGDKVLIPEHLNFELVISKTG